jgi:biotin carboxylase
MSMKKVLIIGASQSCLGLIKTIKRMGHQALVVGSSNDLPGIQYADHFLRAEDYDVESVVSFAQKIGVDAIVPTPVDRTLKWTAVVAEKLGLVFIPLDVAENFRHKYRMKNCLQEANINCANGILTTVNGFSQTLIKNYSYPLIVKPIDGYASRGVTRVSDFDELKESISEASSFSSNGTLLIEEFIDGREFNAEGVCYNGEVEVYAIVEKIRDPFPRTIEMGHIIPPNISDIEENIIVNTISKAVLALGMSNGAFNAEIKLHNGQGYVIEVNGRLAGDFIISHLIKPTTGIDMEEAVVNIALGLPPVKATRNYINYGMIRFFNLPPNKKVITINDFDHLHNNNQIIWAFLFFKEGDIIPEVLHMGHRSGFVIVTAPSQNEMFKLADKAILEIVSSITYL